MWEERTTGSQKLQYLKRRPQDVPLLLVMFTEKMSRHFFGNRNNASTPPPLNKILLSKRNMSSRPKMIGCKYA